MAEGTPFKLTDCTIVSLAKKEGINQNTNRPYVLFKFKVDHPKAQGKEFAKFADVSKPDNWPYEGAKITSIEGHVKQSGQYTNYEVDKLIYDQTSKPPPAEEDPFGEKPSETIPPKTETIPQNNETITISQGTVISYVKDLMVARLAWIDHKTLPSVTDLADELARVGAQCYKDIVNNLKRMEE